MGTIIIVIISINVVVIIIVIKNNNHFNTFVKKMMHQYNLCLLSKLISNI